MKKAVKKTEKKTFAKAVLVTVAIDCGIDYQGKHYSKNSTVRVTPEQQATWLKHKFIKP